MTTFSETATYTNVDYIQNTDSVVGILDVFEMSTTVGFNANDQIAQTSSGAVGYIVEITSTLFKVGVVGTQTFSTGEIFLYSNPVITATIDAISTEEYGPINSILQTLVDRDKWLKENAAILSENESISGEWTHSTTVNFQNKISFETQKHWITVNDGGGNFNIRVANQTDGSSSTMTVTEDGYIHHVEFDQASGKIIFSSSDTTATVGDTIQDADMTVLLALDNSGTVGQIQIPSGNSTTPGISFIGDSDTGMYLESAGVLALSTAGTQRLRLSSSSVQATQRLITVDGSAGSPAYSFISDTDTGMFTSGGSLRFSVSASTKLIFQDTFSQFTERLILPDGVVGAPAYAFSSESGSGMYLESAGVVAIGTAGSRKLRLSGSSITADQRLITVDGSAGSPAYSFTSDTDTGMFTSGGSLRFSASASTKLILEDTYSQFTQRLIIPDGAVTAPAYSFSNSNNSGMYYSSGLLFSVNGGNQFGIGESLNSSYNPLVISGTCTATTFNSTSKREYKDNIVPSTISALDIINQTEVVEFVFKEDESKQQRIGFIADDTHELLAGENHDKMDINNCIGVLMKAVQELKEENNQLKELLKDKGVI